MNVFILLLLNMFIFLFFRLCDTYRYLYFTAFSEK